METIINITELGAYKNTLTGNTYNFKTGSCTIKKVKVFFYLNRNGRIFVSEKAFYENYIKIN